MKKVLYISHNSTPDETSLLQASQGIILWKFMPSAILADLFYECFPWINTRTLYSEEVLNPKYSKNWVKYESQLIRLLLAVWDLFPFNAILSPSDTIYYIRPVKYFSELKCIPFIVAQKETSISPLALHKEALEIQCYFPPICDHMLVCSETAKIFWSIAGCDENLITVTGQPRFDHYYLKNISSGQSVGHCLNLKTILYLSYDVGAYSTNGPLDPVWLDQRSDTEEILFKTLSGVDNIHLLIKPHPQQSDGESYLSSLRLLAKKHGVEACTILPPDSQLHYILPNIDILVAFQTTSIYEALFLGKKVLYTFWSDNISPIEEDLLPFHHLDEFLYVCETRDSFYSALTSLLSTPSDDSKVSVPLHIVESQLGRLDGQSSTRVISQILTILSKHQQPAHMPNNLPTSLLAGYNIIFMLCLRNLCWLLAYGFGLMLARSCTIFQDFIFTSFNHSCLRNPFLARAKKKWLGSNLILRFFFELGH